VQRELHSHHCIVEEPRRPAQPQPLLVMLHGYGSNEEDLIGLAPYLDGRCRVVSVRAPLALPQGGFAWFPIEYTPVGLAIDRQEALGAARAVAGLVRDLVDRYGAEPEATLLLGFSQGAGIALAAALGDPDLVAGVASLSGLVLRDTIPPSGEARKALAGLPVLMTHGVGDPLIPIKRARASHDLVAQLPVDLTWREYDMGHEISGACLEHLAVWVAQRLGGAPVT